MSEENSSAETTVEPPIPCLVHQVGKKCTYPKCGCFPVSAQPETTLTVNWQRAAEYLDKALYGFIADPPDTDFQRGYREALRETYRVLLGRKV